MLEILRSQFYFIVLVITALYTLAFFLFLSPRFHVNRPSRGFAFFLLSAILWAVKDALIASLHPYLSDAAFEQIVIILSPLYLFVPNFGFGMMISIYNATVDSSRQFRETRVVQYALAAVLSVLYIIALVDHSFLYEKFTNSQFDYSYMPGPGYFLFLGLAGLAIIPPALALIMVSVPKIKSESFFIGLGTLVSFAIIFATTFLSFVPDFSGLPRLGCLSLTIISGCAFYSMHKYGVIFSLHKVFAERDILEKMGLGLTELARRPDVEELYTSLCTYAREISGSLAASVITFNHEHTYFKVRGFSSVEDRSLWTTVAPLTQGKYHPLAENSILKQQILNPKPMSVSTIHELFGDMVASLTDSDGQIVVRQVIAFPVILNDVMKGALLLFKGSVSRDWTIYNLFAIQAALVMKFARQIRQLDEKQKIAEQLKHIQKLEAIGLLAGGIAHDFNNILSGISGFAQLLKRRVAGPGTELAKYVDPILDASARGASLTKQLLAFAQRGTFQQVPFSVHEHIDHVVKLLSRTIDKNIQISSSLRAALDTIIGDPGQIENALLNVGINARDAMPDGGRLVFHTEQLRITESQATTAASRMRPGTYVVIAVADTGIGMSEEVKKRLFEPFFTTKDVGKGTGLSLASVYGCVKSHDGYIDIDSAPDKGTAVRLYFPIAPVKQQKNVAPTPLKDMPMGKGSILIVDDEDFIRTIFKEMLQELGFSAFLCANGREGVDFYRQHQSEIDLIIVDMIMPAMGGAECVRIIRTINPGAKIIVSSGYSVSDETQQMTSQGVAGFLHKPFEMADLARVLSEVLNSAA